MTTLTYGNQAIRMFFPKLFWIFGVMDVIRYITTKLAKA